MRKVLVLSDMITLRLLKGYVEPFAFSVKHLSQPSQMLQIMQETGKKILFFDEVYTEQILKYV
jgi:hypothetical protein